MHACKLQAIDYTAADTLEQLRKAQLSGIIREGLNAATGDSDED